MAGHQATLAKLLSENPGAFRRFLSSSLHRGSCLAGCIRRLRCADASPFFLLAAGWLEARLDPSEDRSRLALECVERRLEQYRSLLQRYRQVCFARRGAQHHGVLGLTPGRTCTDAAEPLSRDVIALHCPQSSTRVISHQIRIPAISRNMQSLGAETSAETSRRPSRCITHTRENSKGGSGQPETHARGEKKCKPR